MVANDRGRVHESTLARPRRVSVEDLDGVAGIVLDVDGACTVAVTCQSTETLGVRMRQGDVRRMLTLRHEGECDVVELEHGPRRILIRDLAFEHLTIPRNRRSYVGDRQGKVMDSGHLGANDHGAFAASNASICEINAGLSGVMALGNEMTLAPFLSTKYLWKFHCGCSRVTALSA